MSWRKKFFKNQKVQSLLAALVAGYLLLVRWTCLWKKTGFKHIQPYWASGKPVIVVFWHNRMAMAPFAWGTMNPFFMLISPHSDGLLISKVVRHLGIQTTQGSSSHQGGSQALKSLITHLKKGHSVGITPDGPRGPCEELKEGVFTAALLSQCPVFAVSFATSRHRRLKSWDRFFLPLPFGRGALAWSPPLSPPESRTQKALFLSQLRSALQSVTDQVSLLSAP